MKKSRFKSAFRALKSSLLLLFFSSPQSQAQSLLWEITGNGLSEPSYLYGTIHVGDKRVFNFKKSMLERFDKSAAYAMELHPDSINQAEVLKYMMADSGKTLKDYFSAEDYQTVETYCREKLHLDLALFQGYKPFFLYAMITQAKFGNQMGEALDIYLFKKAKGQGKQLFGLEKPTEQFEAISSFGGEGQGKMLMEGLDDEKASDQMIKDMVKSYCKGDLDNLIELMNESEMANEMEDKLLTKRNYVMADRAVPLIRQQSTFIAVGAAHLPGEEGVIELLRKKGFEVKPIK